MKPELTELEIRNVAREEKKTPNRNYFLECDTNVGKVAFWGDSEDKSNIEKIQKTTVPFKLTCECIPSNWEQHALWVPQTSKIWFMQSE